MKKICSILAGVTALSMAFAVGACGSPKESLAVPQYMLLDDVLYWEPVENAVGYVVAVNGEPQPQQNATYFRVADRSEEASVRVKAIAGSEYLDSEYGAAIVREGDPASVTELTTEAFHELLTFPAASSSYSGELPAGAEAYAVTLTEGGLTYYLNVPSSVSLLRLTTRVEATESVAMKITLASRSTPFILELAGARLNAPADTCFLDASAVSLSNGAGVIVRSVAPRDGEVDTATLVNSIVGGSSTKTGTDRGNAGIFTAGSTGGAGGAGSAAIVAERVVFSGNVPVEVSGGNGARGGKGGAGGYGGDGGDGGDGGKGGDAVTGIAYICTSGTPATLMGGTGGEGGAGGATGFMFDGDKGATGATGKQAAQTIVITGTLK